jgi:transcriptional regulator with XRE-family HTH domain
MRSDRGWSQVELARRAKLNRHTIRAVERADGSPAFSVLVAIARALGVDVVALQIPERRP